MSRVSLEQVLSAEVSGDAAPGASVFLSSPAGAPLFASETGDGVLRQPVLVDGFGFVPGWVEVGVAYSVSYTPPGGSVQVFAVTPSLSVGSGGPSGTASQGAPARASGTRHQSSRWNPGTNLATVEPDTLFLQDIVDEADALAKGALFSADYNNYFGPSTVKATVVNGPGVRKASAPSTAALVDFMQVPPEGLLPTDEFTLEFMVRPNGADMTALTLAHGWMVRFRLQKGSYLQVRRGSLTVLTATLYVDGQTQFTANITIAAGDLPADTWKALSVVVTASQMVFRLGPGSKTTTVSLTGSKWPYNKPWAGDMFVSGQLIIGGYESTGSPGDALNVADVHIRRYARTLNSTTSYKGPTVSLTAGTTQGAMPELAGIYAQYPGWRDQLADGQTGGGGPGVTGNAIRNALFEAQAADGMRTITIDHVFDKVTVGGTAAVPVITDWSALDGPMDLLHAQGVGFFVCLGYTPPVLGASHSTPPSNYNGYAKLCSDAITHWLAKGYRLDALTIWSEPENHWTGTKTDFANLWLACQAKIDTDHGTNALVPDVDVPADALWTSTGYGAAVIDAAQANSRPLTRIWLHDYSGDVNYMRVDVENARAYAASKGFSPTIKIGMGEWNYNLNILASLPNDKAASRQNSSLCRDVLMTGFVYAYMVEMLNASIDLAYFTRMGILDASYTLVNQHLGLFTADNPPRPLPSYAAIQAWWKMRDGTRLSAASNWPGVRSVAAKDADNVIHWTYGTFRLWRPKDTIDIALEVSGLPAEFTWRQYKADHTTAPEGRLVLVGSGDETNLPHTARLGVQGVGYIEITPA